MGYSELKKRTLRAFRPILALEEIFPVRQREKIERVLGAFLGVVAFFSLAAFAIERLPAITAAVPALQSAEPFFPKVYALLYIFLSLRTSLFLLSCFFDSYYFKGLDTVLHEHGRSEKPHVSYEVASIIYKTPDDDITSGFVYSAPAWEVLVRCGIFEDDIEGFLASRTSRLTSETFNADFEDDVTLSDYAEAIFENDAEFSQFLFERVIQEKQFIGAALWIENRRQNEAKKARWWSRDRLSRLPGIGKDWSYGRAYLLESYGGDIRENPIYAATNAGAIVGREELELLETILLRSKEANAMLVGEEGTGKLEIIARLARKIDKGDVSAPLEHKRVMVFDSGSFIAAQKDKGAFEETFLKLLEQVVSAGSVILVIENFASFMESAKTLGSDVVSLLDKYFTSKDIQIIATSDPDRFHRSIENDTRIMRRFERVLVGAGDEETIVRVLQDAVLEAEASSDVFFTYPALEVLAVSAGRYFPTSVQAEKAVDLLTEVVPMVLQKEKKIIEKKDVLELVESKTGIPVGEVDEGERQKLLSLDALLHERVIGQDAALSAVSSTMQRARAGVRNPDKPMGSFLFLGPTGVGKTETAKTLAAVFFGSEDKMLRFDMSEYRGGDALERLLGSFETGKTGTLVSTLREHQYGVLLLDEFEKTNPDVHDLFLQILDEGQFADAHGKKVNARNVIVIATSNAGSELIWEYFQKGEDVSKRSRELIDGIIKKGTFKPELINRFDGAVVFHPLSEDDIRKIAVLMLDKLKVRLKEQGIDLVVNEALISLLVSKGYDPEFGARPMNRVIQEEVEQKMAEKLLKNEIKYGQRVEFSEEEFRE